MLSKSDEKIIDTQVSGVHFLIIKQLIRPVSPQKKSYVLLTKNRKTMGREVTAEGCVQTEREAGDEGVEQS